MYEKKKMKANIEIIQSTTKTLVATQPAAIVADYINKAIAMHREYVASRAIASMRIHSEEIFALIFYAEPRNDDIVLFGFRYKDNTLDKSRKIKIALHKNSKEIQDLLNLLYRDIVEHMQV